MIEFLVLVGELEEKGHAGDSAETALLVHKQDVKKVSGLHLSLFGAHLVSHRSLPLFNGLVSSLVHGVLEASGSV